MTLSNDSLGTPIAVGSNPYAIAITPDQATAYVANQGGGSGSRHSDHLATNTAGTAIPVGTGPAGGRDHPRPGPAAVVHRYRRTDGVAEHLRRHGVHRRPTGRSANYQWNFGDGTTLNTATPPRPTPTPAPGMFTATLTETDTAGTSTTQVFTGQTVSRNGGRDRADHASGHDQRRPTDHHPAQRRDGTAPNPASFTTACSGSPAPTVQWQLSTDSGVTWNNISGATSSNPRHRATSLALRPPTSTGRSAPTPSARQPATRPP